MAKDLKQVDTVKAKLVEKGWPQSLADHLEAAATVVRDESAVKRAYWAAETVLDVTELPLKLTGKEDLLDKDQLAAVEAQVTDANAKATVYTTKKGELDKSLRHFMTNVLQSSIKIT